MRIPESAVLVSTSYAKDDYGVRRKTETEKTVYGYYDSLYGQEIFEGGRNGLNPQFRFVMVALDYDGQTILIRDGVRYSVYRTYRANSGKVELYCERKGGTNGNDTT